MSSKLWKARTSIGGAWGAINQGECYSGHHGVPADLAGVLEPYEGPRPLTVFDLDLVSARIAREKARVPPAPDRMLEAGDLCQEIGWTENDLAEARSAFNFPAPRVSYRIVRDKRAAEEIRRWPAPVVEEWLTRFRALAKRTKG